MPPRNLDDLMVFVRVVDCGSFSAAARSMDLAPTTVSKQIARLEKQFGTSLFERNTRRLKITDEGQAIAERARGAIALLEEASEIARAGSADLSGTIRVTAPVPFGSRYVATATAAFRKQHPKVGFELHLTDRMVDLYTGDIDVAIRVAKLADSRLIARRLADNRRILVAAPDYLERHGTPAQPLDLADHTCLLFSYPGLGRNSWTLRKDREAQEIAVSSDLATDSGDTLRTWCVAGLGVSLRELWDVADDLRAGRLVHVLPGWEEEASPISFVRPRREPVPKRLGAFGDFLAQLWRNPPWET
ncbi:LysR family transcriptional regulator [Brucella intermedia GD04153]|uniref:LysR family transcriptional regulator n=1 Tax=Brucella intermedia GD04153 TaxID=2975438 RepID=A0AA42H304_9HYPH|nr:LysR family transcriptional regulator [Brucella intermedia]MDH0127160.1 LysR family transcriptional regulator [Brucella intermedia GD04153]RRD21407.1 LysR family transcriptional regulator [Brucellaceae bacterium VT-16-1752]